MASDDTPRLSQQRAKRMLRDMEQGAFAVLAWPDGSTDSIRIYASGLDARKMQRIEAFIEAVINE
jgi:hypothetical protein